MIEVQSNDLPSLCKGWTNAPVSPVKSAKKLRSNLLHELGIVEPVPLLCHNNREPLVKRAKVLKEPLKDNSTPPIHQTPNGLFFTFASLFASNHELKLLERREGPAVVPDCQSTHGCASEKTKGREVRFSNAVAVVTIPRWDQYSNRIRQHLWDTPTAMRASLVRNTIEFAAERNSPKNVLEEHEFMLCPVTGGLIHPIHYELAKILRCKQGLSVASNAEELMTSLYGNGKVRGISG